MSGRPRAADVILGGGLAAGLLDIVNAIVFWRLYNGASATAILQSVASGLLGKPAFAGGSASAALGLFLHLLIMCAMAACSGSPAGAGPGPRSQRPVSAGIAYGLVTWAAMNHVVVPLSRAAPPPFIPAWFADGLLAHILLVGLVFAFVARWSARRAKSYS